MKKLYLAFIAMLMSVIGMQAAVQTETLYLMGTATATSWKFDYPMTKVSDNVFTWSGTLKKTTSQGFKFLLDNGNWNKGISAPVNNTEVSYGGTYELLDAPMSSSPNKEFYFNVSETGDYTITADLNTMKLTVSPRPEVENLYLIGKATTAGWSISASKAIPMSKLGTNVFTWIGTLTNPSNTGQEGEFLFINSTNESSNWAAVTAYVGETQPTPVVSGGEYTVVTKNANSTGNTYFKVPETDTYSIIVDLNAMTMKIDKVETGGLYLIGQINNYSANTAYTNYPFTKLEDGVYYWGGNITGWFNIITGNAQYPRYGTTGGNQNIVLGQKYDIQYYESTAENIGWRILEEGNLNITIDLNNMKLWVDKRTTGVDEVNIDENEVEYYNLQGVRVDNPTKGLYIKRQGNKATKVIL